MELDRELRNKIIEELHNKKTVTKIAFALNLNQNKLYHWLNHDLNLNKIYETVYDYKKVTLIPTIIKRIDESANIYDIKYWVKLYRKPLREDEFLKTQVEIKLKDKFTQLLIDEDPREFINDLV